jgi:hypothetical protein
MSQSHLKTKRTESKWTLDHNDGRVMGNFAQHFVLDGRFVTSFRPCPNGPRTPFSPHSNSETKTNRSQTPLPSNSYVTFANSRWAQTFGFHIREIDNRSIRSGAAMALFMKDHLTAKIMILGRWSLDAFLVYIRHQVVEWANNMSRDMVSLDSFFDVGLFG